MATPRRYLTITVLTATAIGLGGIAAGMADARPPSRRVATTTPAPPSPADGTRPRSWSTPPTSHGT